MSKHIRRPKKDQRPPLDDLPDAAVSMFFLLHREGPIELVNEPGPAFTGSHLRAGFATIKPVENSFDDVSHFMVTLIGGRK